MTTMGAANMTSSAASEDSTSTVATEGYARKRSHTAIEDIEYCGFDINSLPEEVLLEVLVWVRAQEVVRQCSLVSRYWLRLSRDQTLWSQKCVRSGRYVPSLMGPPPDNFMVFFFRNPYTRNLLKNTHATEGLTHWNVLRHFRQPVSVEPLPSPGVDPIADHVPSEEIGGRKVQNWVTSYQRAAIVQRVRLLDEGCSEAVLDKLRPPIHVSAWCSARWDCGAQFWLTAKLLDKDGNEVASVEEQKDLSSPALRRAWHKVEHTFEGYGQGVRTVDFMMSGVDTQFWAGNFGSKFTLPCLRFIFTK